MHKRGKDECRKVYFTADTHFGHGNIIKYCNRPFLLEPDQAALEANGGTWHSGTWKGSRASNWKITREAVEMMDTTIIDNINGMVGKNDVLWHLGDFSMFSDRDHGYYNRCRAYRDRINCEHVNIIWGNHDDYCIRDLFEEAWDLETVRVNGQSFVLCHYAMAVFNKSHRGAIQLYGHSHSQAENWMNNNMPGRRSMDVGVDNAAIILGNYAPFSCDEIMQIMRKRDGFSMDHHIPKNSTAPEESSTL